MKKNIIFYCLALISFAIYSCKNKDAFTITGTITNPGSFKSIYLIQQDSAGISVVDSANLNESSKFQFKHNAPFANVYRLRIGGAMFDFIAKNGDDIGFSTNLTDNTHTYQITGSEESDKIKEYNKISNYYAGLNNKLDEEYESKVPGLPKPAQDSLLNVYRPQFMKNFNDGSIAIIKFMNNNKSSLASFYAATSLDSIKYEQQLIAYADAIKGQFTDNPYVQKFIQWKMAMKPVSVGHEAPDFTIGGIDGKPIKLSDFRGKYVMLDFWASWCGPCRQENPNVVKQYAIYKPLGLNILGISLDQDKSKWEQAVATDKLTWSHGSDLKNFEGPTERLYHIEAIPSNFILDPKGIIVAKNIVGPDLEEFLNKTFSKSQQIVKIK